MPCHALCGSVSWVSNIPFVCPSYLITFTFTGVGITIIHAVSGSSSVFSDLASHLITSYFSITLATNLIGTFLLGYRIWSVDRNVAKASRSGRSPLRPLFGVIVDAAILYSLTLVTALCCFIAKSSGQYVVLDMVGFIGNVVTQFYSHLLQIMPIISITFYMVIIRVGISRTHQLHGTDDPPSSDSRILTDIHRGNAYSMNPTQVHITKLTEIDGQLPSDHWSKS